MIQQKTRLEEFRPTRGQTLWLVLTVGLILIPHATHLPLWAFASTLSLVGLAGLFAFRNWAPLPKWILWLAGLLGFGWTLIYFGSLNGRDPGVTLLSLMVALKVLEIRGQRDAFVTVFLGYFLIATQFLFSQEMVLILYLVLTTFLLTVVLIGLSDPRDRIPVRKRIRLSGRMLALSLPMMLLLFILFPRISGPLWGIQKDESTAKTGLSDQMTPGQFSDLIRSDELAFRVIFDETIPTEAERYWRGPVLWNYDGRKWTRGYSPPFLMPEREILVSGSPTTYRVLQEATNNNWIMALDVTTSTPEGVRVSGDLQVYAEESIMEYKEFRLEAYTRYRAGIRIGPLEKRLGLRLPDAYATRARTLARQWASEYETPEEIVNAALLYFRNQPFVYTLSPGLLTRDPVDEFLFDTRRGFCEHYASSFVVLMRAAGIPARVVTGYLGGEYNAAAGYMTVRQSDAHAWAEVWLEEQGWVRVDPTSAVAPERIEQGISASLSATDELPLLLRNRYGDSLINQFRLLIDSADFYWNYWVVAFGPERQQELLSKIGLEDMDWRGLTVTLVATLGGLILIYTLIFIYRNRRPAADPVIRAYGYFRKKLRRSGVNTPDTEGPHDLLERVRRERPDLADSAEAIIHCYVEARYQDEAAPEHSKTLEKMVRSFSIRSAKKSPA